MTILEATEVEEVDTEEEANEGVLPVQAFMVAGLRSGKRKR